MRSHSAHGTKPQMRSFLMVAFLVASFVSNPALACSESGQVDFKVDPKKEKALFKLAQGYALNIASLHAKNEAQGSSGKYLRKAPFSAPAKQNEAPWEALQKYDNFRTVSFSVGVDSANKVECTYCVSFRNYKDSQTGQWSSVWTLNDIYFHLCAYP